MLVTTSPADGRSGASELSKVRAVRNDPTVHGVQSASVSAEPDCSDVVVRTLGTHLTPLFGQPVVVENKPGAAGAIGAELVKNAAPDGYTLMFTNSTTMVQNKVLFKKLPYDPDKDFSLLAWFDAMSRGDWGPARRRARVIAGGIPALGADVQAHHFSEHLFYRLNTIRLDATRRSAPFPVPVAARLDILEPLHAALPTPAKVGRVMGLSLGDTDRLAKLTFVHRLLGCFRVSSRSMANDSLHINQSRGCEVDKPSRFNG